MVEKEYYTISEISQLLGVKPYVLRYWEKEFKWLKPPKNTAGRRVYSKNDLIVTKIIQKLRKEGYSIEGVRQKLEKMIKLSKELKLPLGETPHNIFSWAKKELIEIRKLIESL